MLLLTGKMSHVIEREAGNSGNTWVETTMVVLDFGVTYYVKQTRDFGPTPDEGANVALDVMVRAYPKKSGDGAGYEYLGLRRNVDAEKQLNAQLVKS